MNSVAGKLSSRDVQGRKEPAAMKTLRLAVAQMAGRLCAPEDNVQRAVRLAAEAASKGARLVLFPEACLTGHAFDAEQQSVLPCDPGAFGPLRNVAEKRGITICIGFAARWDAAINNVHAIVLPGGEVRFQRKAARVTSEPAFLAAWHDPARVTFDVNGVRTCITICSEAGAPAVIEAVEAASPELILHPSAGCLTPDQVRRAPASRDDEAAFRREMSGFVERRAAAMIGGGPAVAAANPVGFDGETYWPGNSYVIDSSGTVQLWMCGVRTPSDMRPSVGVCNLSVGDRIGA